MIVWLPLLASGRMFAAAERKPTPNKAPKDAILLSDVQSLTLRHGKMTTSRRVAAVQQLTCTGPADVCKLYQPDIMRCTNEGADYDAQNIQWSCKANLPEEFKLGSTEVVCEGYASREDPYVLKGSCGVEYRLLLTKRGEELYGGTTNLADDSGRGNFYDTRSGSGMPPFLFMVLFGVVLFIVLSGMVNACRRNPPQLGRGGGNWGGGDDNDPPPPYDSHGYRPQQAPQYKKKSSTQSSPRTSSSGGSNGRRQAGDGWRPGPWTAGLAGAGLGYLAGRNTGRSGGGGRREGSVASSSSSAGPSYSSSRYESTGFGGTSRR